MYIEVTIGISSTHALPSLDRVLRPWNAPVPQQAARALCFSDMGCSTGTVGLIQPYLPSLAE